MIAVSRSEGARSLHCATVDASPRETDHTGCSQILTVQRLTNCTLHTRSCKILSIQAVHLRPSFAVIFLLLSPGSAYSFKLHRNPLFDARYLICVFMAAIAPCLRGCAAPDVYMLPWPALVTVAADHTPA